MNEYHKSSERLRTLGPDMFIETMMLNSAKN